MRGIGLAVFDDGSAQVTCSPRDTHSALLGETSMVTHDDRHALAQQVREDELQFPLTQSALTEAEGLFRMDPEVMAGPMHEALAAAQVTGLPVPADVVDVSFLDEIDAEGTVL